MTVPPRRLREIVFQLLYSQQFTRFNTVEGSEMVMRECKISKKVFLLAMAKVEKILGKLSEIDRFIAESAIGYDFSRISSVEKNILRLGLFELEFDEEIPEKVAISEALRICKKYGSSDGISFVNGILDKVYKRNENIEQPVA